MQLSKNWKKIKHKQLFPVPLKAEWPFDNTVYIDITLMFIKDLLPQR